MIKLSALNAKAFISKFILQNTVIILLAKTYIYKKIKFMKNLFFAMFISVFAFAANAQTAQKKHQQIK